MNPTNPDRAGRAARGPQSSPPAARQQTANQQKRTTRRGKAAHDDERETALHAPVLRLRVELEELDPPVWRRIEVPTDITLRLLHDILQVVMGWQDSHLHCFEIRGVRYGFGDDEYDEHEREDDRVLLGDVVRYAGEEFCYEYDYGDDWRHRIVVEEVRRDVPSRDVPRLLDGARACPPEDCGGIDGYYDFLEAIGDPDHEEHAALLTWVGGRYDPEKYDVAAHDRALALFRARRSVQRQGRSPQRRSTRSASRASPASAYLARLLDVLAAVPEALPELPPHTFDTAVNLLRRQAGRAPDALLAVRKPGIWVAAALHAACMLQPRWSFRPLPRLTIEELATIFEVSPASISSRSAELRRG